MAFTFTRAMTTVFGNERVVQGLLTADDVSGVVSFGFATITHAQWTPVSQTTNNSLIVTRFRINKTAAGVASNGDIGISGTVAGDEFLLMVYGR